MFGAVVFFGLAYGVSRYFGPNQAFACLLAILVSTLSGMAWLLVILCASQGLGDLLDVSVSNGPWIRLRVTLLGSVLCGLVIESELVWFLGWTGTFYMIIMAAESVLVIWMLKNYNLESKKSI